MWRDSIGKRRARYRYLLKGSETFSDIADSCLDEFKKDSTSVRETVIRDVSICVLSPAMNAFVIWVLKAAVKKKISRLYFLARDGYFMYITAKIMCERLDLPIDCRYLSCSRFSIRIPMFHFNMGEALDYIVRGGIDVTLDKVLNRAGLDEHEKADVTDDIGNEFAEGVIPYSELQKLRTRLEVSDVFLNAVKKHSEEAFPVACEYLGAEGLFDKDVSFAFVDSGWTGSMQKVLGQLLEKSGHGRRLHGFYWGLYELPSDTDTDDYECYYFGPAFGTSRKAGFSNCLFESVFSAPHGMTLSYEKKGRKVLPVYADIRPENKEFNEQTERYLTVFTEKLASKLSEKGKGLHISGLKKERDTVCRLLDTFMGEPARHEAFVYGTLPFSDDVLDENEQQVAANMTSEELMTNHPVKKILIMTGISKDKLKESAWYEGSAVRNGKDVDRHLRAYRIYKWMLYGKKEAVRLKERIPYPGRLRTD